MSGIVDITASGNNVHINYQEPANQIAVTELVVEDVQINTTLSKRVIGSENRVSGTYSIYLRSMRQRSSSSSLALALIALIGMWHQTTLM